MNSMNSAVIDVPVQREQQFSKPKHIPWPSHFSVEDKQWVSQGQMAAQIPNSVLWGRGTGDVHVMCDEHKALLQGFLQDEDPVDTASAETLESSSSERIAA